MRSYKQPTAAEVRRAREKAGMTQAQAAELVHLRNSRRWGEYERDINGMPLATWELFLIKTGQQSVPPINGS